MLCSQLPRTLSFCREGCRGHQLCRAAHGGSRSVNCIMNPTRLMNLVPLFSPDLRFMHGIDTFSACVFLTMDVPVAQVAGPSSFSDIEIRSMMAAQRARMNQWIALGDNDPCTRPRSQFEH